MNEQFLEFLMKLAIDTELAKEFKLDKKGTMLKHNIQPNHIDLVINKEYDAIQSIVGDNYQLKRNDIIWAKPIEQLKEAV